MTPVLPAALLGLAVLALTGRAAAVDRLADVLPRTAPGRPPTRSAGAQRGGRAWSARLAAGPAGRTSAAWSWRPLHLLAAGLAGLLLGGAALAVAAALVAAAGSSALRRRAGAAAARLERAGAVEACAVLAAELRAGRPAAAALEHAGGTAAGPFRARLLAAAAAARFGADPGAALRTAAPGPPTCVPEVASALAACWQVCSATGNGLAAAVERLEEGLRAADLGRAEVDAELAGPRATAALLAGLPVAGVALGAALGAHPVAVLLHTPVGAGCLVLGVLLDLAGLAWTRRTAAAVGGGDRAG